MADSGDTNIDFTSPMSNYKGRIKYDNTANTLSLYTNSSTITALELPSTTATFSNNISAPNVYSKSEIDTTLLDKQDKIIASSIISPASISTINFRFKSESGATSLMLNDSEIGIYMQLPTSFSAAYTAFFSKNSSNCTEILITDDGEYYSIPKFSKFKYVGTYYN